MPVFYGVDVQRREYRPRGKGQEPELLQDWTSIDLAGNSQELRAVKLYYNEDPPDLRRVMLHEDHLLVMPLPHEYPGSGKYPDHSGLKSIKDSIEKMKKADPKGTAPPPAKSKFGGEGNPFKRDSGASSGFYNSGGEGNMMSGFPGFPGKGKGNELPGTPTTPTAAQEPPDNIYVRVYDTDIQDGRMYEYRLRVKLKNPNFGKKDLVSKRPTQRPRNCRRSRAAWSTFPEKVTVPQAGYHYVVEYTKPNTDPTYPSREPQPDSLDRSSEPGRPAVPGVVRPAESATESLKEPVGDWVVAEMLATVAARTSRT